MDELIFGLLLFNLTFTPVDYANVGLAINDDSKIYVEEYGTITNVELDVYFDVYVAEEQYGDSINFNSSYEMNFALIDRIEIRLYDISISNNYFYCEGDFVFYNIDTSNLTDHFVIEVNLYEDFYFENDLEFGYYTALVYDIEYVDGFYYLGYQLGFKEGYGQATEEGQGVNNVIEWFGSIWDGLANILALQIAPNLTIGTIITIPIVIAVLFFGLRALIQ